MSSHDHRRAQLVTPQCVERVFALDKMCINQKETRLIEMKPTRTDDPAVLHRGAVDPPRSAADLHSDHASMPCRTAVAAEAMNYAIGRITEHLHLLSRMAELLEDIQADTNNPHAKAGSRRKRRRGKQRRHRSDSSGTTSPSEGPRDNAIPLAYSHCT